MSNAPENIWAITEPDDVSADILGDVYAQQVPDGMNGTPIKYIREDVALARVAKAVEALSVYAHPCDATETTPCGYEGNMCCMTARTTLAELTGGKDE